VAKGIAVSMNWLFAEGDAFHPEANVEKMHSGVPLTDEDRWPWLAVLHDSLARSLAEGRGTVLACSALKESYREALSDRLSGVRFVLLDGDRALLRARLANRPGHFMNPALLDSQLETLERPADALLVDIAAPVDVQVAEIRGAFGI
jgi:carbohydrate kinase (thermoresistant glucokinase family)